MSKLRAWFLRISGLFGKERRDRELAAELESHLQMHVDDNLRAGMAPKEAWRQALIRLGGIEQAKESYRERRGVPWLETLLQDVRFGLRMLRKNPGFTAVAFITLALGIGANTVIFSVINSVLLEPLPFKNPQQLLDLRETESAPGDFPLDGADYLDWQAQNSTFSSMSLYSHPYGQNASGMGSPESASVCRTQANFFQTLGVQPLIGRAFAKGEDQGAHHVVILSYGFWQRHFGGQASVLGKTLELNDEPYTIIGVTPRGLNFPSATDLFVAMDMTSDRVQSRGSHWASAIGRMKPRVTIAQARADLMTISERLIREYRSPDDTAVHSLVFPLKERLVGDTRDQLLVLLSAVALVLLVACANIANLLLARSTGRQREMALRMAFGASRWRLARQLLTESVLLSLGGAAVGLLGAWFGVALLQSEQTLPIPRTNPVQVDVTVLLFTAGVSLLVGILFGLAPALQTSQVNLNEDLKSSANPLVSPSRGGQFLRGALISAEIAVSLALLVGAGLLLRTFAQMRNAKIGVQTKDVLTMNLDLPDAKYTTQETKEQFFRRLLAHIDQIPGVKSAAASMEIALEGGNNGYATVPGNTNQALAQQLVEANYVTPDYFNTFGISFLEGRSFTEEDSQRAGVVATKVFELYKTAKDPSKLKVPPGMFFGVIINETMARTFWPNQDPIGKPFTAEGQPLVVLAVVGDEKQFSIRQSAMPECYFPLTAALDYPGTSGVISVKTAVAPTSVTGTIQRALADMDNGLALYHVRTMEQVVANDMQSTSLSTFLLGVFAALALLLAAIGLYGVTSYLVTQRTHEIGIRMALGAQRGDVLRMVMREAALVTGAGIVAGIAAALGLTRFLKSLLFDIESTDPATFVGVTVLLLIVALAACWIPARRAMRVDPMVALRYE